MNFDAARSVHRQCSLAYAVSSHLPLSDPKAQLLAKLARMESELVAEIDSLLSEERLLRAERIDLAIKQTGLGDPLFKADATHLAKRFRQLGRTARRAGNYEIAKKLFAMAQRWCIVANACTGPPPDGAQPLLRIVTRSAGLAHPARPTWRTDADHRT